MLYVEDDHGNRATIARWGSEEAARASLATLQNCQNCVDCSRCSGCSDCSDCFGCSRCSRCSGCSRCSDCFGCSGCSDCSDCSGCSGCSDCSDCPSQPATANRSDNYMFAAFRDSTGTVRVNAGCRRFSLEQAREHWTRTRGGTRLGDETMAILDYLEKVVLLREASS